MRIYKKRNILEMISALQQANRVIRNVCNKEEVMNTLLQCQQLAVRIGELIEQEEEVCERAIQLLEDYCDKLYQQSLVLMQEESFALLNTEMQVQLDAIEEVIRAEIREEKVAVFLPYKASMWDSLEGVWRTLEDKEEYKTFVIPIPYFDRNRDGSFGQLHYEGGEYPADVPVTSWQEYDLQANRPDEIYIHNPYDAFNRVTSVHPDFYAEKLKEYTDMLVYIPYFVGIDDHVDEHFCVLPGTLYAHKVLVESEAVREIYLKELKDFEKEQNCRGKYGDFDQKLVVYTSPKYDKVKTVNRGNIQVPGQWEQLIYRADGSRKKVFLYNISVDTMLKQSEVVLDKIKYTLDTFRKNSDVVLLWRPHPLYESTLQSMHPELLEPYRELVRQYREEGWGIFDDTTDMNRAIALSDAYYGDGSSLVSLYRETKKPIMIQNYKIINEGL